MEGGMTLKQPPTLSIIIPALNEASRISLVLEAATSPGSEIIVADGGSTDATADIAAGHGARVIKSSPGRGPQLAAGAEAATGQWLLFLHADTRLSTNWRTAADRFMAEQGNLHRAAVFRFRLDDDASSARRLETIVAWRTRAFGLPYGDQGLLISRAFYQELGGYRPLALMEDVDIVRRIGNKRLAVLEADALTSSDRYRTGGYILRPLRNLLCRALYFLGIPNRTIERLYR